MKLSIIVPVYNMAADGKLEYCLNSLVRQTLREPYEIIAVDDASTDNSLDILREYEAKYGKRDGGTSDEAGAQMVFRVLHNERNRRQGGAKNAGLKVAEGEWIGFIDSDDWVTPEYYEKLLRRAEETGADMVGCDYNLVHAHTMEVGEVVANNDASQTGELDLEKHKKLLMRPGSMVIKIYRHDVIQAHHLSFPEGIFYEDNCAGPLWSLYFKRFERVEEPLYYYYQHDISTVHRITEERCRDRMKAAELLYGECKIRGFLETYREEIEYRFTELYYVNTLFSYMSGVKHPKLSFVKELRRGVKVKFPDFRLNTYFRQYTGDEEQELIGMQAGSDGKFYWYYRMKLLVRRLRSR
ncbi:MAG: glycosyltransferase [Lachnospiraceae bacterium]|nr:glycosyltransferase [Lachnospiraceae bacterium]